MAVLLATAMLLSVCAVSVFAEHEFSTNQAGQLSEYYDCEEELTVEGWADPEFNLGKNIFYGVTIMNHMEYEITYDGYVQCIATFSDDSIDVDVCSYDVVIETGDDGDVSQMLFLNPGKTLISVDGEFQVSSSGYLKWTGSLSHAYTPGIDL